MVIVNFGDYFCCIHIYSAKLFISSQTFVNLKYIQKLEISYEFDVRLIFTPMYGGFTTDCTIHASAAGVSKTKTSKTKTSKIKTSKTKTPFEIQKYNVKSLLTFDTFTSNSHLGSSALF